MSTIKVDNIRIASESVSRPVTGVAAAWANFNGSGTVAIGDSINVGSVVDTNVGRYTINFSNDMDSINYATSTSNWQSTSVTGTGTNIPSPNSSYSLTQFIENGTAIDPSRVSVIYHGKLA